MKSSKTSLLQDSTLNHLEMFFHGKIVPRYLGLQHN